MCEQVGRATLFEFGYGFGYGEAFMGNRMKTQGNLQVGNLAMENSRVSWD